jgi:flavin-dependent dehydrogenase
MQYFETIVVGGGPAGSSCAWQLKRHNREVLILDKDSFPRLKLCAGWISAPVLKLLEFTPEDYPHGILELKTRIYVPPIPFPVLGSWATPWRRDYSIRRVEFDHWLLQRSQAPVVTHQVKKIERQDGRYVIDGKYACDYLVGAGGTGCPVRRTFFPKQRVKETQILTIEKEFEYPQRDDFAHIFFCFHGLGGYSWYVPKGNGYVNLGLGGFSRYFTQSQTRIHDHFQWFLEDLVQRQLLDDKTRQSIKASGHGYYVFTSQGKVKTEHCFLIGDSAGLASSDLGEGIAPAVESGVAVANEILGQGQYDKEQLGQSSPLTTFWRLRLNPSS